MTEFNSAPPTRRNARTLAAFAVAVGLSGFLASCAASPHERFEILSFFFDGVPDPDAALAEAEQETGPAGARAQSVSLHKPVVDARCPVCHGEGTGSEGRRSFRGGSFEAVQRAWDKCRSCHSDPDEVPPQAIVVSDEGYMHGPVAVGDCKRCHHAHQSRFPHLLRTERAEAICVTCHDTLAVRDGAMAQMDCTECHDPHRAASADDMFLRGGRAQACAPCHEIDTAARPWVHGPVAAHECEACHDAHGAPGSERHVRRPLRVACLKCHDALHLPTDAGCDPSAECDTCHEPHAAPRASDLFLRDRIPASLPVFVSSAPQPQPRSQPQLESGAAPIDASPGPGSASGR